MARGFDYELVVIGGGIGGLVASVTASSLGKKVAIVEKRRLGGNCTSLTCIPSKALVRAGHVSRLLEKARQYGLGFPGLEAMDNRGVMARVRSVVEAAYAKDVPETFEAIGIRVISGRASFLDRHHVKVEDTTLSGEKFIIASGTRPLIPKIPGLEEVPFLTNESVYQLETLPESILILGGGADGLEYACAFRNLGMDVTVVQRGKRLLPRQDRQMVQLLAHQMKKNGIGLYLGASPVECGLCDKGIYMTFRDQKGSLGRLEASALLVTVGRELDVEDLGLERAGVDCSSQGILTDKFLRTSAPNIYACGDVTGPYQLASTAEYQGILAATNAFLPFKRKVDYENVVFVLFTDPPLAYVGLSEEEGRKRYGGDIKVYSFEYRGMRRAMVDGCEEGAAKFLCDKRGKLVGAHILGEAAPEVIHEAQVVRSLGAALRKLHIMTHAYPTYAQALVGRASQLAFLDYMEQNNWVRLGFKVLPGLKNCLGKARERLAESHESCHEVSIVETNTKAAIPWLQEVSWNALQWDERLAVIALPELMTEYLCFSVPANSSSLLWIVLDFSRVAMINGLGALSLARLCMDVESQRKSILAVGLADHYVGMLKLTGLSSHIKVCDSWDKIWQQLGFRPKVCGLEQTKEAEPKDMEFWAKPVERFPGSALPDKSMEINIKGRQPCGVLAGFGCLWQKTYELRLHGLEQAPELLMAEFKSNFSRLQAPFNRFYAGPKGIHPGEVVTIHSRTPGGFIATGVMVLYADPVCFSLITPQGHPEAGWMTFRAIREKNGPMMQIVGFGRASDPLFEVAYRIMGSRVQVKTWCHVLAAFAEHMGVRADISIKQERVSKQIQWRSFGNIKYNAQIRTILPWNVRKVRSSWASSKQKDTDA